MLPVDAIEPNPHQPRRIVDGAGLEELARSIRSAGVMQPIVVRRRADERFELVAGERRWRASRLAGLTRVPAIVRRIDDEESAAWAIIENVQREDLNPIDRARALRRLGDLFELSHAEIADRVGLQRSSVSNLVRLTELEEEIQDVRAAGVLTMGHGRALLAAPAGPRRLALAKRAAADAVSVRVLERAASGLARPEEPGTPPPKDAPRSSREANLRDLERQIGDHLGTKVQISMRGGTRGRVAIEFFSLEHFDELMQRFGFRSSL